MNLSLSCIKKLTQAFLVEPGITRVLYVRNLPLNITLHELKGLFDKYGPIKHVQLGTSAEARGSAFVLYENPTDANKAQSQLGGYELRGRFLIILFYECNKDVKRININKLSDPASKTRISCNLHGTIQ